MSEQIVNTKKNTAEEAKLHVDPTWKGVYQVGGLSLAAGGVLYLIGTTLSFYFGGTPGNSQAFLQALAAHPVISQITYWIFALADIFFIPAILGLYLALKGINKNAMLIAAGFLGVRVIHQQDDDAAAQNLEEVAPLHARPPFFDAACIAATIRG